MENEKQIKKREDREQMTEIDKIKKKILIGVSDRILSKIKEQ